MKTLTLFALLTFSLCNYGQTKTAQDAFLSNNKLFKTKFENKISNVFKSHGLYGDFIIGIVDETGLVYSFALNREILNGKTSSLNNDSPIYLASHTKSFTGTLLEMLEEEGKIDLNKSIHHYLPELVFDGSVDTKTITVKQLLNHTHGIGTRKGVATWKTAYLGYSGDNQELIDVLNANFTYDSSGKFRYSNLGPVIAAMVAEKVAGKSWKEEMKKRIFLPLKMKNTASNVSSYNGDIRPSVFVSRDKQIFQSGFYKKDITMHAAGGTISTVNDLSNWLRANIVQDNKIFKSQAAWKLLHNSTTPQDRTFFTYKRHGYSLGWDIATYQNDTILTRFGGYAGISFHISFIPSKKIGVIAFSGDSRGGFLPYLAANYAYNLINQKKNAEEVFTKEEKIFEKNFRRRGDNSPVPSAGSPLKQSAENDRLVGTYKNEKGWNKISIEKKNSTYIMKWGVLEGNIYGWGPPNQPYVGALGALLRPFNVEGDTLRTGSLIYKRIK